VFSIEIANGLVYVLDGVGVYSLVWIILILFVKLPIHSDGTTSVPVHLHLTRLMHCG